MKTRLLCVGLLALVGFRAEGADAPARLLAFAVNNRLTLMIGEWSPKKGWIQSTDFYAPPDPGDVFTLYGPQGRLTNVKITEPHRADPNDTFAGWSVQVSSWDHDTSSYALAVSGQDPLVDVNADVLPLDNPIYQRVVARYLKSRGLHVDAPLLTQVLSIPLQDPGREEVLLTAHSDASALTDQKAAAVYAVALLWWNDHGKQRTLSLASQTSFKPASRTIADHVKLYGPRDFMRLISAPDIDGDGGREIILYRAKADAIEMDVFTFNGRRLRQVLSTYKPNYN